MKIVAVTACPTGIAHTYMAAESLESYEALALTLASEPALAEVTPFSPKITSSGIKGFLMVLAENLSFIILLI